MNIFYIALNTIKRNLRDKKALLSSILMPILMIIILGTALNSRFQSTELDKLDICYLNLDSGTLGKEFERFLEDDEIKEILNVKVVTSIKEGEKLVNDKKAVSLLLVPQDYSEKLEAGKESAIKIYNTKYADFKNTIVENIVDAYNSAGNTIMAIAKLNSSNSLNYIRYKAVDENILSTEGNSPRGIDYYAVAMLVLAIMSSAGFAGDVISEDYFYDVSVRIKSTPIKSYERLLGKIIGCVFDIFIKAVIIIVFSKLVYKVNWGNNFGMIAIIVISAAVFSTVFGMFVAMVVGNGNKASGILNILNNVFTFGAGGYAVLLTRELGESVMMHLSPNFYPQAALFNVIYSNNYSVNIHFFSTFGYISMLWAAAVLLFIGFITVERRRVR
ncbi:permease [Clostridium folliculivorans]|uniref:Permease n=1 Tax=Clostridium folliculivorans TaxID=2886038 RepID=A0A9W5Y0M0_9CLOT|nr:ABC transporter permease [Clostridium folliculivorans]GKU24386.1 permease [Clostridium folliculivorans]